MENLSYKKKKQRLILRQKRSCLSFTRKDEAAFLATQTLKNQFLDKKVLSFWSFSDEINFNHFNLSLLNAGNLYLPKMVGDTLEIYHVVHINQLSQNSLKEPIASKCIKTSLGELDIILVPGLGFDKNYHRIGYGKGYYDRLLARVECKTVGICFHEQIVSRLITEIFDKKVDQILSF